MIDKIKIEKENVYEYLYRTRDLAEASFLVAKDVVIESIERDGGICWFVFQNKEKCEKLVNSFWFENGVVPAKKFYEANKILKDRIFGRGGNL